MKLYVIGRLNRGLWIASLLLASMTMGRAAPLVLTVSDTEGIAGRCAAPVSATVDLSGFSNTPPAASQFRLIVFGETESDRPAAVAAQFEPDAPDSRRGTLLWLMPPGPTGRRKFTVEAEATSPAPLMRVRRDEVGGQFEVSEGGQPVLRYNYQTNEPGGLLAKVTPDNLQYARARSDYIHPLYGPDGLSIRLTRVKDQAIVFHTDPAGTALRRAWADLSGVFPGGHDVGLAVFQAPSNPDYPGDWIKYPEINWFQPTFPAAGTRYVLKKDRPLVLKFRLFIHSDKADEARLAEGWTA